MALASSGSLSFGGISNTLSVISVTGQDNSIANVNFVSVSGVSNGDIIIVTGADSSNTQVNKLNGIWMVANSNPSTSRLFFNIYTNDPQNALSKNILASGIYTNNLGTWKHIKKTSINIEAGLSSNAQTSLNNSTIRQLAQKVSGLIKLSDFYSKYFSSAYIYSGNGDEIAQRYIYTNDTIAPITSTAGNPMIFISGTGNYTMSIFGGGYWPAATYYNNQTRKYIYATDIRNASTNIRQRGYATSIGNATVGLFAGGKNSSGNLFTVDKYTYSTGVEVTDGTVSNGTNINASGAFINGSAVGNTTFGFFSFGQGSTSANFPPFPIRYTKYTYSSDTVVTGTNSLSYQGDNRAPSSGPNYGLFVGGGSGIDSPGMTRITKYTYSTGTISESSSVLSSPVSNAGGTGNSTHGYFFNGSASSTPVFQTRKFAYSGETLTTTSTLVSIPYVMDATSSSPGGF